MSFPAGDAFHCLRPLTHNYQFTTWRVFLKKLIRVFIAVFCLFFALLSVPDSFLQQMHDYISTIPRIVSEATLRLAESIDDLTGNNDSDSGKDKNDGQTQNSNPSADAGEPGSSVDAASPPDGGAGTGSGEGRGSGEERKDIAEQIQAGEEASQPEIYYYYTQLSREERLLYDAMYILANSFAIDESVSESRLLDTDPASETFAESYTRAYNALIRDHPEFFWIAQEKAKYECKYYLLPSFGGKYKIVLSLLDTTGQPITNEDGTCIYMEQQARMEQKASALLDQVDYQQSDAGIALQLHDLLIDNAWYNTGAGTYDYAHTAYGALVEDSQGNAGGALCDGYALAYEYLLQRAGITCIVVSGYAGPSEEDTEKHAWNLVELDDEWYEVDPTWDDLDFTLSPSEDGYDLFLEATTNEEYMSRIRHYMFNLTTEQMRSFTPGDEFTYTSNNGWVTLLQPSVHIRSTAEESEVTRDYVTPLAPVAEGTWYTWDMLTGQE